MASALEAQKCMAALGGIGTTVGGSGVDAIAIADEWQVKTENGHNAHARRNFLAYRSTVVLVEPPLIIEFPHTDGQIIAGDLVTVRHNPPALYY